MAGVQRCPECGERPLGTGECVRCEVRLNIPLRNRRCAYCDIAGSLFHGLCTDPFGDRQVCYCFAENELHRLQHDLWLSPDDDMREGADGLDSSPVTVRWREGRRRADDAAVSEGSRKRE